MTTIQKKEEAKAMEDKAVVKLIEDVKTVLHNKRPPDSPLTDEEIENGVNSLEWRINKMEDFEKMFSIFRDDPGDTHVDMMVNAFFYQLNKD